MIRVPRWPGEAGGGNGAEERIVSAFTVATTLLRHWRLLLFVPLTAVVAAVAVAILTRTYTAEARFVPQSSRGDMSRLAGLAAQIGVPLGMDASGESPDFYVDLVESGEVLGPAMDAEYVFARRPGSSDSLRGTWLDLTRIEGETAEERARAGIDVLRDNVSASASVKSGIVTVRTVAPWPGLAESLNARILDLLARFDRQRRQSGAQAERVFIEERYESAKQDLEASEASLARFLDRNRRPESPRLMMELERQQRIVAMRQQVYAALAQAYEQARIEEVRNTPVITIVDRPEGSARPTRGIIFVTALALMLGLAFAAALAFLLDYFARHRHSAAMHELRAAIRAPARHVPVGGPGG